MQWFAMKSVWKKKGTLKVPEEITTISYIQLKKMFLYMKQLLFFQAPLKSLSFHFPSSFKYLGCGALLPLSLADFSNFQMESVVSSIIFFHSQCRGKPTCHPFRIPCDGAHVLMKSSSRWKRWLPKCKQGELSL